MARRDPFKEYRVTTIEERKKERQALASMQKTKQFDDWFRWAYDIQRKQCFYCDTRIYRNNRRSYHIEHRIPIYWGGKSDYSNLCIACPSCNMTKSTDQLIRNKRFLNRMNERRKVNRIYL